MTAPTELRVTANRISHQVAIWEPERPISDSTLLCAHGFLDLGFSFRQLAERLCRVGHRVVAFDWRGHGLSDWVGSGGYYYFLDYVADLDGLVEALVPGPLHLLGHSMGGTAACLYAGAFPGRVEKLVLLEGLGPSEPAAMGGPERTARWIAQLRRIEQSAPTVMGSLSEAVERMQIRNPGLGQELGLELAARSTRAVEGGYVWSFDPLHRTQGPFPFRSAAFIEYLERIRAPTLCIDGAGGYRAGDQAQRQAALPNARHLVIPDVGHMLHWFAAQPLSEAIDGFLRAPAHEP